LAAALQVGQQRLAGIGIFSGSLTAVLQIFRAKQSRIYLQDAAAFMQQAA